MIDIIVPVYNSYNYLKECVESILKKTPGDNWRLILINDKSTEKEVNDYFKRLKKEKNKKLIILENNQNLGFVGTVNRGMQYDTKNDVLLLNSDTVVTKNWLRKIHKCAYSSEEIAAVTPLSNNGDICSVPNFGIDNEIPKGFTVDEFAQMIEEKSLQLYPEIPTVHGFCVYIKRKMLDMFGYFDVEHFAKGYGEENDFSRRVKEGGFMTVLADDTFIYHKGSASFSIALKKKLGAKNIVVLEELHPGYQKLIEEFCLKNPLLPIHQNIHFWINNYDKDKKKVLLVKHFEPGFGGIGRNTEAIITHLNEYAYYVLYSKEGSYHLDRWDSGKQTGSWIFPIEQELKPGQPAHKEMEKIVEKIIEYFDISLVHFQHLLGSPLSLLSLPKKYNVPSILSIHDNFLISTSTFLEKEDGTYFKNPDEYIKFINKNRKLYSEQHARINYVQSLLPNIDQVFVPSNYLFEQMHNIFPDTPITIIEHGVLFPKVLKNTKKNNSTGKLTAGFLGVAAPHKGIFEFLQLIDNDKLSNIYNWVIIGPTKEYEYLIQPKGLSNALQKATKTGGYTPEDLPDLIAEHNVDLFVFPALCPETYSYTLSESIQCNIPVIGRDLGAIGDRIKKLKAGWVFDTQEELEEKLEYFDTHRDELRKKAAQLKNIKLPMVDEMISEYRKLYRSLLAKSSKCAHNEMSEENTPRNRYLFDHIAGKREATEGPDKPLVWRIKSAILHLPLIGKTISSIRNSLRR